MKHSPSIFVAIRPDLYQRLFSPESDALLCRTGKLIRNDLGRDLTAAEFAGRIGGCEAVITGWGVPAFSETVMAAATDLKLIAHSAGSIKHLIPQSVFERGVAVTHAAAAIAPAVAEMSLLMTMMMLRPVQAMDAAMRSPSGWQAAQAIVGEELAGKRVGVIGAGYTGRKFIKLLVAMEAEVWACDPYLEEYQADQLGVRKVELDELLEHCPIVSLQAPATPETRHMIGTPQLAMLQDGAIFINTARPSLVDEAALLKELQSGRIRAALDVYDSEPLPDGSPFRQLPNVLLTPHVAGITPQAALRQGAAIAEEVRRFFSGESLQHRVRAQMLATMA